LSVERFIHVLSGIYTSSCKLIRSEYCQNNIQIGVRQASNESTVFLSFSRSSFLPTLSLFEQYDSYNHSSWLANRIGIAALSLSLFEAEDHSIGAHRVFFGRAKEILLFFHCCL
jgi:hypothetical protein